MTIIIKSKNIYNGSSPIIKNNIINKIYVKNAYSNYNQRVLVNNTISGYEMIADIPTYSSQINADVLMDISSNNTLSSVNAIADKSVDLSTSMFLPGFPEATNYDIIGRFQDWILFKIEINKSESQSISLKLNAETNYFGRGFERDLDGLTTKYNGNHTITFNNDNVHIEELQDEQALLDKYFTNYENYTQYQYNYDYRINLDALGYSYMRYWDYDYYDNYDKNGENTFRIIYINNPTKLTLFILALKTDKYCNSGTFQIGMALSQMVLSTFNDVDFQISEFGTGNKSYIINENESKLLTLNTMNGTIAQGEYLANRTLANYKNGKETATLLCSISDYYDTDGNKVISVDTSDKMMFDIGDVVIPYIYTAQGVDAPMSVNKDGTPKQFKVVGTRPFYDGAVWQELTLLEKTT